jgi:hypothetical protein
MGNLEWGIWNGEFGMRKSEWGRRNVKNGAWSMSRRQSFEFGIGNAEFGKKKMRYSILDWAFGIVDFDKENV